MSRNTLSDAEINEALETFNLFDNRGDGKIESRMIGETVRALNLNPTEAEIQRKTKQWNQDERIGFESFMPIYQELARNRDETSLSEFLDGFKVFDKDQNGTITSAELRHLMTSLGEKLKDEEMEQLLSGLEDAHGNVNYEEFVKMVMNG